MEQDLRNSLIHFIVSCNPNYLPTKLHTYLCALVQTRVTQGGARLCISVPPRHGKSEIISKHLPAWFLGHNPRGEVMEICHTADLATEFGGDVRALMSGPIYSKLFPDSVPYGDGKAGSKWRTQSGGKYKGEGIDGSFTGFGANLLVVDDIVKNRKMAHSPTFQKQVKETFGSTIFTRLLPDSNIIILNTRWTAADLIGYTAGELGWEYINLPAIALDNDPLGRQPGEPLCPERYPLEALEEIRDTMTPYDWEALYQGIPPDEVKRSVFGTTPPETLPTVGVWYGDRVLLMAGHQVTHIGGAESITELEQFLVANLPNGLVPVWTPETSVANHPYAREVIPTLCYSPALDGYNADVSAMTIPAGAKVSPQDTGAMRYSLTVPKVAEYKPGRLALGGIISTR